MKYRFINPDGYYLHHNRESLTLLKRQAGIFTQDDWDNWGEAGGYEREQLGPDEQMKLAGAARLPGFEDA